MVNEGKIIYTVFDSELRPSFKDKFPQQSKKVEKNEKVEKMKIFTRRGKVIYFIANCIHHSKTNFLNLPKKVEKN